jgi:phosphoribosylglycinamide formyltransferase 1
MKRIVILISGRGSNMQAIVQACQVERWDAAVVGVISNVPDAEGLVYARSQGIAADVVDHKTFASRDEFDRALSRAIDKLAPDVVAMAGFMRILGAEFVRRYAGRMLNIHPSLLPAFAGLNTHRKALETGCKVAGTTVHFVTSTLDHGPIVMQAAVHVMPGDTEASLAARVLAKEHVIYPRSLRWLLEDQLLIEGDHVKQLKGQAQWLL